MRALAVGCRPSAPTPSSTRGKANDLLSSVAIEVRAAAFYLVYESALRAAEAPFSLRPILRDEDRHFAELGERLREALGEGADGLLSFALAAEAPAFVRWESEMAAASGSRSTPPVHPCAG